MIIDTPRIIESGPWTVAEVDVRFQRPASAMPPQFQVRVPKAETHRLSTRGDGYLIALILLAMRAGEPVEVRAPVSPQLLHGIDDFQRVFQSWYPDTMRRVEVIAEASPPPASGDEAEVFAAFSGGVDSFFTLHQHLQTTPTSPGPAISCGLFAHGFDIPLDRESQFTHISAKFEALFDTLGKRLIPVHSNLQAFGTRYDWPLFHGAALIALAHILGHGTQLLYVPSSHDYGKCFPWGSTPFLDPLLSSESLRVVHDGAWASRSDKIRAISVWPATHSHLRVCIPGIDARNCCRCEKCLRTMTALEMIGVLKAFTTFPEPLRRSALRRCRYRATNEFGFAQEVRSSARAQGRRDVVLDVTYAILRSRLLNRTEAAVNALRRLVGLPPIPRGDAV
jgi:hypothetical protein